MIVKQKAVYSAAMVDPKLQRFYFCLSRSKYYGMCNSFITNMFQACNTYSLYVPLNTSLFIYKVIMFYNCAMCLYKPVNNLVIFKLSVVNVDHIKP